MKNLIVFLIDGLNPRLLSPYGCTWVDTPAFDRLAAESIVFQQAVSETIHPAKAIVSFLSQQHPASVNFNDAEKTVISLDKAKLIPGGQDNDRTILNSAEWAWYTDDPSQFEIDGFDRVVSLSPSTDTRPETPPTSASHLSETRLATSMARLSTELPLLTSPFVAFVHLSSLISCWDAPLAMREKYRDEEDPEASTVVVPDAKCGEFDPDDVLRWSHAYAAQIETLDSCLGVLLDELNQDGLLENTIVATIGLRSFPVGHGQQFGNQASYIGADAIQVPLMIRFPEPNSLQLSSVRYHRLTSTRQTVANLIRWATVPDPSEIENEIAEALANRQVNQPLIIDGDQVQGIWTPAWLATVCGEDVRLFVKPDDRWDINPVQDRCRWIAQELADVVRDSIQQIKEGKPIELQSLADELMQGLG